MGYGSCLVFSRHLYLLECYSSSRHGECSPSHITILNSFVNADLGLNRYRPNELFKRSGVWYMSYSLGGIFSGQLQAKAYRYLNGVGGLAGWRWLFILDGCISLPIALLGFLLFPGLPAAKKPWWMTEDEHAMARRRVKDEGIVQSRTNIFSRALLKRLFTKWHFYIAVLLYSL